jgi:hypothetical protein
LAAACDAVIATVAGAHSIDCTRIGSARETALRIGGVNSSSLAYSAGSVY